jgi:hypothetical protein
MVKVNLTKGACWSQGRGSLGRFLDPLLFCLRNIAPLSGVAGTTEVVLDAVAG